MREKSSDQVKIGFSSTCDWLRGWSEFFWPIAKRSRANPDNFHSFNTQLEIALSSGPSFLFLLFFLILRKIRHKNKLKLFQKHFGFHLGTVCLVGFMCLDKGTDISNAGPDNSQQSRRNCSGLESLCLFFPWFGSLDVCA